MEEWKPIIIDGLDTGYQISNKGRAKTPRKTKKNPEGIMKPRPTKTGYLRIGIHIKGKCYDKYVHRLVAEAFIPNPENKGYVNHIDAVKSNNEVNNLEWVTRFENMKHCFDNELCSTAKPVLLYTLKGEFFKEYVSISEALREVAPHLQGTLGVNSYLFHLDSEGCQSYGYQWRMKYGDNRPVKDISHNYKKHDSKIVQLSLDGELVQIFNSITDACRYLNKTNNGAISQVCKGNRKTTYGYKWMYYDDYLKTQEEIV